MVSRSTGASLTATSRTEASRCRPIPFSDSTAGLRGVNQPPLRSVSVSRPGPKRSFLVGSFAGARQHSRADPATAKRRSLFRSGSLGFLPGLLQTLVESYQSEQCKSAAETWLHEVSWSAAAQALPSDEPGRWLILADRGGVGDLLARELTRAGHVVSNT